MITAVLTFGRGRASLLAGMNPSTIRIRRATTDDFQSLRLLWNSVRLPAGDLEKRLTEFQVVEAADGQIVGAIGVQIIGRHALLHSEGYTDFAAALSHNGRRPFAAPTITDPLLSTVAMAGSGMSDNRQRQTQYIRHCYHRQIFPASFMR